MHLSKITYLLFTILYLIAFCVLAQQEEMQIEEQLVEHILENLDTELDVDELLEKLSYYMKYPIDLNKATERELGELIFLTPTQIANIIQHRESTGSFLSFLELQGIDGIDIQTLQTLEHFVRVNPNNLYSPSFQNLKNNSDYQVMTRIGRVLEKQQGYLITDENRSRYLGTPYRIATRIRMNYENRIRLSINMDKDAGEPFLSGEQRYGFDFYSASLQIKDMGKLKALIIGDYALQFGQGLVVWNGLSFGKGSWTGSIARQGIGLRQYTSLNENNFMRGASVIIAHRKWSFTPFVAWNKLSGNMHESHLGNQITSINYSGYHRTPTEQGYRRTIDQYVYGANIDFQHKRLKIGSTWLNTQFNGNILPANDLRNIFAFKGNRLQNVGLNYQYTFKNVYFFGETAHSLGSGWAIVNGLIASLSPKLSAVLHHRSYQTNYHHFFAQGISEQSALGNEKGMYAGLTYHPNRKIEWINYLDLFSFPWLRFRVDAPSTGLDFLSQFSFIWHKKGRLTFRYRDRLRQENISLNNQHQNLIVDQTRRQARIDFQFKLNNRYSIRSRAEFSQYKKEHTQDDLGYLLFQDIIWKTKNNFLTGNLRLAYFNTDSYNARIYTYEQDILYAASFPNFYGKGIRTYSNFRFRINKHIDIWTKYALTSYFGVETVGSQLDLISGNKKSDIKIQVRFQW